MKSKKPVSLKISHFYPRLCQTLYRRYYCGKLEPALRSKALIFVPLFGRGVLPKSPHLSEASFRCPPIAVMVSPAVSRDRPESYVSMLQEFMTGSAGRLSGRDADLPMRTSSMQYHP